MNGFTACVIATSVVKGVINSYLDLTLNGVLFFFKSATVNIADNLMLHA